MERDGFVFYKSFMDAIELIPTTEAKLEAYQAVCTYGLHGEEMDLLPGTPATYILMMAKAQINANNKRFADGSKGGAPKGNQNARKQPKQPVVDFETTTGYEENNQRLIDKQPKEKEKEKVKDKDKDNVKENGKEKVKEETPTTPTPTSLDSDPEIPFRYGESQNVILTDMEHKRLVEKYGTRATDDYIDRLSVYMDTTGKQYQGKHFSVIQQWMRKDNVPQITAPLSPSSDLYARALKIMEDHSACGAG